MDEPEVLRDAAEDQPVIDIHPPHEAAHSWRDIFIHLATITVGLFIALSLEGCVEWQHHRHLVKEARANIRSEIEDNQKNVSEALTDIHKEQKQVAEDMATFSALEKNTHQHVLLTFTFSTNALQHASWDTARETGALGYMPYAEVKSYAELQDMQEDFARHTERLIDAYTPGIAYLYGFGGDQSAKPATSGSTGNGAASSAEIAKSVTEGRRIALNIQSELLLCENIAQELQKQYATVLSSPIR